MGSGNMILPAMKVVMVVVFLGTIMMWIMMPTMTFRQIWLAHLKTEFSTSTYFGAQGTTILIYTFPILFIAVLGCVYLHLHRKFTAATELKSDSEAEGSSCRRPGLWKKPMVVKGPLGIVSGTELAFLTMFVALLVWSLSTYLRNGFATITPKSAAASEEKVWEVKLETAALRLGVVGNICLAFLFFPVARGSSVLPLLGITSEASIKYHVWLGHMVLLLFTSHGLSYIIFWAATGHISHMLKWAKIGISNLAGEISLASGLVMWATTIPGVRHKFFELFFYTHYLYIVFMVFFVFHVGISYACIMLPGFYIFMIDRYLRFLQSRQRVRLVSARVLPCEVVELDFSKTPGLSYNPTSIVFINVPSISKLQWHPFTITSSSKLEPEKLSVMIKSEGSWSKKLYNMLSSPKAFIDRLEVSVEGPYGPVSTHLLRHDTLVMVSGGSGITPFISIIRELIFASTTTTNSKNQTPKIILISAFRNSNDLTMLDLLLPLTGTQSDLSNLNMQIEAFVTREREPKSLEPSKNTRAMWFKPNTTDAPISPILGPSSWLWLGAIISSSFVLFLVLIGVIDRYYIYPVDHNTNKVFSNPLKSLLNMLVICISIAATASAAFVWNKKRNAMEAKQIQNMEGTPAASPNTWFYNADSELESLPHQSIVQATNVHYGERPNLKKMLFDCKETSVGVLVCGPKKMRHEVAAICSSGLADNLQFESISFSW